MLNSKKPLLLDLGNVVFYVHLDEFKKYLSNNFQVSLDRVDEILDFVLPLIDTGHGDIDIALKPFLVGDYSSLIKNWKDMIQPCQPMVDFVKKNTHQISILSNIGKIHKEHILNLVPDLYQCNNFFSCDIGLRKPNTLLFKHVKKSISKIRKNDNIVDIYFFDDRDDNVDVSSNYFQSFKFNIEDYKTDKEAFEAFRTILEDLNILY